MRELDLYKRRYQRARAIAYIWWPQLEAAYHYCIPNRNLFYYPNQTQGAQKNIKVYDTTQVAATENFVSKIHSALTPPKQSWAFFDASELIPEDSKVQVEQGLKERTDIIFDYLHRSNFDLIMNEFYHDLAVGTAILVSNDSGDDDNPLIFSSIPLDQVAIEESISHRVETCFRAWGEVRVCDIETMWPRAQLTSTMRQLLQEDPSATVKNLIEGCIYIHNDKKTPYRYVLWNEEDLLMNEKQESSAFIISRWSKINNEVFGRGPILHALPSILSLQTAAYFEMTAANLNICKPYMGYSDGIFNPYTFRMAPNTIIPISPNSAGQVPIIPLPDVANPAFMQITTMDLRQQINTLMFANPLGPINEAPTKTATELALRQRNLAEEIGPIFTRLQQELLEPILARVIYILERRGLLPELKIGEKVYNLKYRSPLTISQGQQDVQTFLQYQQIMQGTMGPEASLIYLNTVKFPIWLAKKLGVDPTIINDEEEVQAELQNQAQKQAQMQMMTLEGQVGG